MTPEGTLMLLAVITALSPFIGVPYSWLMVIVPFLCILMFIIAISIRLKRGQTEVPVSSPTIHEEQLSY